MLSYYLPGFPLPSVERPAGPRRMYWAASLGASVIAGWSSMGRRDVREFLASAGFTEILVSGELRHFAGVVGDLRAEAQAGRRGGLPWSSSEAEADERAQAPHLVDLRAFLAHLEAIEARG